MIEARRDGDGGIELVSDNPADVEVTADGVKLSPEAVGEVVRLAIAAPGVYADDVRELLGGRGGR